MVVILFRLSSNLNAEAVPYSGLEISSLLLLVLASGCFLAMIILVIANFVWIYGTLVCTRLVNFLWWCMKTSCSISIPCCHTTVSTSGNTCITLNQFKLVLTGCLVFLDIAMIFILFLASGGLVTMTVLAISNLVWMCGTKVCTRLINSLWSCMKTCGSIFIQFWRSSVSTAGKICIALDGFTLVFTACFVFLALVMIYFKIMPMRILLLLWTLVHEGFRVDGHMSRMMMIDVKKQHDDGDDAFLLWMLKIRFVILMMMLDDYEDVNDLDDEAAARL